MSAYEKFPLNITRWEFEWFYNTVLSQMSTRFEPGEKIDTLIVQRIVKDLSDLNYTTFKDVQGLFERHKEEDIFDDVCKLISS